jgi:hypothetical protein
LGSDLKVKVTLEASPLFSQSSNGIVSLNTWTSITVTIVQTMWNYASTAIVINDVFDVGQLNSQTQVATSAYLNTDITMIGGAPNSLVGIFAYFTIFSPGSMAFSFRILLFSYLFSNIISTLSCSIRF